MLKNKYINILGYKNKNYGILSNLKPFIKEIYLNLNIKTQIYIISDTSINLKTLSTIYRKENKYATVLTFNNNEFSEIYISIDNIIFSIIDENKHKEKIHNFDVSYIENLLKDINYNDEKYIFEIKDFIISSFINTFEHFTKEYKDKKQIELRNKYNL